MVGRDSVEPLPILKSTSNPPSCSGHTATIQIQSHTFPNSNGVPSISPGLRGTSYPGYAKKRNTLKGFRQIDRSLVSPQSCSSCKSCQKTKPPCPCLWVRGRISRREARVSAPQPCPSELIVSKTYIAQGARLLSRFNVLKLHRLQTIRALQPIRR